MTFLVAALVLIVTAALAYLGTRVLLPVLRARAMLDFPNERSSHKVPTPRGGGIAVIAVLLAAWIGIGGSLGEPVLRVWGLPAAAFVLAAVSFLDDLKGLGPLVRLAVQAVVVGVVLYAIPADGFYFQGLLPAVLDSIVAGILWVWFINLFNFMDGIDGISGVETFSIGVGVGVIVSLGGGFENQAVAYYGMAAAGTALGFLKMNWDPAKIFMGDVGSVPLGFLLGWLLLSLAASGAWAAAIIVPSYYLCDATVTLCRRAARGEKIWRPHRQHFYQVAVQRGMDHGAVALGVLSVNGALVILAAVAMSGQEMKALAAAAVVNVLFLFRLSQGAEQ